jgi:UPF0271 protein
VAGQPARAPSIDINADLGEGFPYDEEILGVVSSASVACGFHAGDPLMMVATAAAAAERGVAVGAHPSYLDREGFGRTASKAAAGEISALVAYQIGAMSAACGLAGTSVSYVKLHGALYNQAASQPAVAEDVLRAVASWVPPATMTVAVVSPLPVLCPPGSELALRAASFGVTAFSEFFADRAYNCDGTLADRRVAGALVHDVTVVAERVRRLLVDGTVDTLQGGSLALRADSICVHGDTPGALELARCVRRAVEETGASVAPFAPRGGGATPAGAPLALP